MRGGFGRNNHGIITVFVVLIMVPVVVITGTMVDIARAKLFAAQIAMSSDAYGEAILSEYDNVLKELYGLFSVTQNEEALKAVETLYAQYMECSLNPGADGSITDGSMFFQSADVEFSYDVIEESRLSNENVLLTQVADYMEFRVIPQVIGELGTFEGGVFDMLDGFSKMQPDNEAVSAANKLCKDSDKLTKNIKKFHDTLEKIQKYEDYLDKLEEKVKNYRDKEAEICKSGAYDDYVYYLKHKDEIKALIKRSDEIASNPDSTDKLSEDEKELVEKYRNYDADAYRASIEDEMGKKSEAARDWDSEPADFDNIENLIVQELKKNAEDVEDGLSKVETRLAELRQKLVNGCSEDVKNGIEEDIKELEELAKFKGKFQKLYDNEVRENINPKNNEHNKTNIGSVLDQLDAIKGELAAGNRDPGKVNDIENKKTDFKWAQVETDIDTDGLYKYLHNLYSNLSKEKSEAEKKQDEAMKKQDGAVNGLNEKEEAEEKELAKKIRSIPDDVKAELKMTTPNGESSSFADFFNNGFSFQTLEKNAAKLFDKFLLTEYDFGMFSSRVSGKEKEKKDSGEETEEKGGGGEEYADYSLSKVKMSPKINYLYGAEIEYLYGGHQKSEKNLASARNVICGVRMTMNFISTYSVDSVNNAIKTISQAAYDAALASGAVTFGAGSALAPLVKVAVSLALRSGIAAMETVKDWEHLKDREDVPLFKRKVDELYCIEDIKALLGDDYKDGSSTDKSLDDRPTIKMSYEDYLHVLLFLFVSPSDLTSRTSDLITLNVNQSQKGGDKLSAPLAFKMTGTVTAIKTSCKAKLDMVVVPPHFYDMFLGGNETQQTIEGLDDDYINYTMIRGY